MRAADDAAPTAAVATKNISYGKELWLFGGGGRGYNGGRGGRGRGGRNNDSVVQKIQHRVSQQRKDIGGISLVVKNKDTPASPSRGWGER